MMEVERRKRREEGTNRYYHAMNQYYQGGGEARKGDTEGKGKDKTYYQGQRNRKHMCLMGRWESRKDL